tara:strand:+ start:109 stop:282 length:174 start_codon:yes stop_codon:yes gene_type:complete
LALNQTNVGAKQKYVVYSFYRTNQKLVLLGNELNNSDAKTTKIALRIVTAKNETDFV